MTPITVELVYAARFPGKPGFGAICVDSPEFAKQTAKDVAAWIRKGATIERVTIDVARAGMLEFMQAKLAQIDPGQLVERGR